jgi:hypothetical protein
MTTRAPAAASSVAIVEPIPPLPPVMSAILFFIGYPG